MFILTELSPSSFMEQCCHACLQVRRLQMYKKTAKRDKKGKIVQQVSFSGILEGL